MMHLHGFGLSGQYLLPTAELLAGEFPDVRPDLPSLGRSGKAADPLDVPDLAHVAAAFLDDRKVDSAVLVGNSRGCAVICEFAHPVSRATEAGRPRGTSRWHEQPAAAAGDPTARP